MILMKAAGVSNKAGYSDILDECMNYTYSSIKMHSLTLELDTLVISSKAKGH